MLPLRLGERAGVWASVALSLILGLEGGFWREKHFRPRRLRLLRRFLFRASSHATCALKSANSPNLAALLKVAKKQVIKKFAALRTPITGTREVLILNKSAGISGHAENFFAPDTVTVHSSRLPIPRFGTQIAYEAITTRYFLGKPR